MAVTRTGRPGLSVVSHAMEERNIVIVHAPISRLQAMGGTVTGWDELQNHGNAIHLDAQVKLSSAILMETKTSTTYIQMMTILICE